MTDRKAQLPLIPVEVACGTQERQRVVALEVPVGTSAREAVLMSNISRDFPEIDPERNPLGIFSKLLDGRMHPAPQDYPLKAHERVEIYFPLVVSPEQARLARAGKGTTKAAAGRKKKQGAGVKGRRKAEPKPRGRRQSGADQASGKSAS